MTEKLTSMHTVAMSMLDKAYAPYSHFQVGVCIQGKNGKLYAGCNIESASFGLTLCAEAVALSAMIADGERTLTDVLVLSSQNFTTPPCGACRQRLIEFADKSTMVHFADHSGIVSSKSLWHLLPEAFSPQHFT